MIKILFICHGNICRSPMAEFIFKKLIAERGLQGMFQVDSAATSTEEIGNDIYPPAKACLKAHGVPFERHAARQVTKQDMDFYDHIIVMESYNIANLERRLGKSAKVRRLLDFTDRHGNISDPWYSGDFETAFAEIEEGCRALLEAVVSGDQ